MFCVLATQRQQKHTSAADVSARVCRSSLRSPGTRPVHEHRPMYRCLTRRRGSWLRVVICKCSAAKRRYCRESILPTGETCPQRLQRRGSATIPEAQDPEYFRRQSRGEATACRLRLRPFAKGENTIHCLGAAQLTVEADERPNAAPGGRAASTLARRTASRRLQRLNVNTSCIAASGAPLSPRRT